MWWPWITLSFVNTGTGERDSSLAIFTNHYHMYIKRVWFKAIQAHDDLLGTYFLAIFYISTPRPLLTG